jgi:lipopolysaccharide transport protein LptA
VAGASGAGAQVSDEQATIEARVIDITLEGQGLVADRDVRSVLKASSRDGGAGGVRRPGMLKQDQPVNVTAAHLVYDSANGRAVYTGEARLWQGETAVQGATIVLDDKLGNLTATGGVRSSWRLMDTDPKTKVSEVKTTVATSADLVYEDEQRRATYTTDARLNGPEGDLRAQKIELYLATGGDQLERLEAYTDVTLHTENRESAGARLSYFAADDRYVMSTVAGAPDVRILEQLAQECRETLGKTLTFHRATDTIAVDGSDERRTQTTSGGKCPEPRPR